MIESNVASIFVRNLLSAMSLFNQFFCDDDDGWRFDSPLKEPPLNVLSPQTTVKKGA